ncbi:hypothetical protein BJ742DRAFT_17547 [Cladochytrium replicatum]|nr:hypothetical protein BJ742DRAFT_17547 [Cladochytrium replicatum]
MVAYWLIFAPSMIYALRNMNDTYGIRLDLYITSFAAFPCFIAYFVISTFTWHFDGFGPNDVIYIIFGVSHTMHTMSVSLPLYIGCS